MRRRRSVVPTNEPTLIDCRGLACPQPVLTTKEALEAHGGAEFRVVVDDRGSCENVRRFAESQGAAVHVREGEGEWELRIAPGGFASAPPKAREAPPTGAASLLVTSDQLGPEPELGRILIRALLGTLTKAARRPARVLFLNRGVHLTTEGSEVLDVLAELEAAGVEILSCGTCLEFFAKRELLRVGRISNMYETVEVLTGAQPVVPLG
jgi:selenium metabolism protein YedF